MGGKSIVQSATPYGAPARNGASSTAVRAPRQSRGQARIEAILDAAAAQIAEDGVAAVTMHSVARRAHTSIGSMYHFFPDRDSLLQALLRRHIEAIRPISDELMAIPASTWRALSPAETIRRLATPYVAYFKHHADYLPLMYGREALSPDNEGPYIRTLWHVLTARLPALDSDERENYVAVLHSIGAGTMQMAFQIAPERVDFFMHEIPRAMTAYLADIETAMGR